MGAWCIWEILLPVVYKAMVIVSNHHKKIEDDHFDFIYFSFDPSDCLGTV